MTLFSRSSFRQVTDSAKKEAVAQLVRDIEQLNGPKGEENKFRVGLIKDLVIHNRRLSDSVIGQNNPSEIEDTLKKHGFPEEKNPGDESDLKDFLNNLSRDQRVDLAKDLILIIPIDRHNERIVQNYGLRVPEALMDKQDLEEFIEGEQRILRRFLLAQGGLLGLFFVGTLGAKFIEDETDNLRNRDSVPFGSLETGECVLSGSGLGSPYDWTVTVALSEAQNSRGGRPLGHCQNSGGSIGNYLDSLAVGYPDPDFRRSIAVGQKDVFEFLKTFPDGHSSVDGRDISALKQLLPENNNLFETAVIAATDARLQTWSDILEAIRQASPDKPFKIGVPNPSSGSFFTASELLRLGMDQGEDLIGKFEFVHMTTTSRMRGLKTGEIDIAMSVQYPGRVERPSNSILRDLTRGNVSYLSTMRHVMDDPDMHLVSIEPEEFQTYFVPNNPSAYNLRSADLKRDIGMIGVNVVVASRDPSTMGSPTFQRSMANRNNDFRDFYHANPDLFMFDTQAHELFPVLLDAQGQPVLKTAPSFSRRAFWGGNPQPAVIDFG